MEIREFEFSGPVIAVHAHPDDETLTSGGLLASCVMQGVPVSLVTCTRGEQGEVIGADPLRLEGNPPALGAHRERELAAAMAALGVHDHLFLDEIDAPSITQAIHEVTEPPIDMPVRYVDSGMSWVEGTLGDGVSGAAQLPDDVAADAFYFSDLDAAATRLAGLISERHATTVVTYEPGGGYGHPDHVRAYQVAVRAVELVNQVTPNSVRLLSAIIPQDIARFARGVLATQAVAEQLVGESFGGKVPSVDDAYATVASHEPTVVYTVSLGETLPLVLNAMREHATQIQWVQTLDAPETYGKAQVVGAYALSNNIIAPILNYEYYAEI